jgi:hypothetical protein
MKGRELTSDDVVYTFERGRSEIASAATFFFFDMTGEPSWIIPKEAVKLLDKATAVAAFRAGQFDVIGTPCMHVITESDRDAIVKSNPGVQVRVFQQRAVRGALPQVRRPGDVRVR